MTHVFVPLFDPPRKGKGSARVGWITNANGCDIWQGARGTEGYGIVHYTGKLCFVHRVRYEREVGPIPEGMELDHYVCDNGNGGCCSPFHCRPVTRRENALRSGSVASLNAAKTHCPKGHPLSGENLYSPDGVRRCRTCLDARWRDYRVANREARNAHARAYRLAKKQGAK